MITEDLLVAAIFLGFAAAAVTAFTLAMTTEWSDNAIKVVTSAAFMIVAVLVLMIGAK